MANAKTLGFVLTKWHYAGQYTHPGIGVPMTVISATVVDEVIAKDVA